MDVLKLECSNLSKQFKTQKGIDDLNIDLEFNGLGLLGPNGSGKSTFIKLLIGLIFPTTGEISINVDRKDIRFVSDKPALPGNLTINKWLDIMERIYGTPLHGVDIQTDLNLEGHWKISNLSAGQTRKVALLPVFYGTPKLIILDEPSNYLDITTREYVLTLLKRHILQIGAKIIISTHNVDEIRLFADHVLLLKQGQLANQVELKDKVPEMFSLKVSNMELISDLLDEKGMNYHFSNSLAGNLINIYPHQNLWEVIQEFEKLGGEIYMFKIIDVLERMIEELINS